MFVGYRGRRIEKEMLKMRKEGTDFWSQVTKDWEAQDPTSGQGLALSRRRGPLALPAQRE